MQPGSIGNDLRLYYHVVWYYIMVQGRVGHNYKIICTIYSSISPNYMRKVLNRVARTRGI